MNIFVCFTPLHIIISERIIKKEKIKKFKLIYFSDIDNEKHRYYYDRLARFSCASIFLQLRKKYLFDLFQLYNAYKLININKECVFYTGNIKKFHCRLLMMLKLYSKVITFDDGSGNISGAGYFYNNDEKRIGKLVFKIFDNRLLYSNIQKNIFKHYTIFTWPNVFPKAQYITLFDQVKDFKRSKNLIVLLTNAFAEDGELSLDQERNLYKKILTEHKVTHVIHHPREKYSKLGRGNYQVMKQVRISEEIILDLAKENNVSVIGVYSTVLLNLSSVNGVKIINYPIKLAKPTKHLDVIFNEICSHD